MFLRDTALYWNFIKENWWSWWKGFTVFWEKITSWACLVRSGLNIIFHSYVHSEILFKPLFTTEKIDVSWAKHFTFNIKLLGRSFTCIKNSNEPKIDPCSKPALISSHREFLPLSKTLWYLLPKKLWNPIASNLYIIPSSQTLSKAFDISKNSERVSRDGKLSKDS